MKDNPKSSPADDNPRASARSSHPPLCRRRSARLRASSAGAILAAWLGPEVPRPVRPTGGKPKLLGISKRGNKYLRRQLIHGARARLLPALPYVAEARHAAWPMGEGTRKSRPSRRCDRRLRQQAGRIAWAALRRGERFAVTQECRWRHRTRPVACSKRPTVNRGLREGVTTGWPDSRTTLRKPGSKNGAI